MQVINKTYDVKPIYFSKPLSRSIKWHSSTMWSVIGFTTVSNRILCYL